MYKLGSPYLSGDRGAQLVLNPKEKDSPKCQIDVVAIDEDVAVAVECKASATFAKRACFIEELAKHGQIRSRFVTAVRSDLPTEVSRQPVFAIPSCTMRTSRIMIKLGRTEPTLRCLMKATLIIIGIW